ncbi:MAG: class I SAM-dependent methyltransferase, partial [Candidatus Omnitrophota bacterium]
MNRLLVNNRSYDKKCWDEFSVKKKENKQHIDVILGQYKSEEFIRLVEKWSGGLEKKNVLKTDLCEEAFGEDQILFSLPADNSRVFAVDISEETVRKARGRKADKLPGQRYLNADVRSLPFKDNVFDLILSTSTLDHFAADGDLAASLKELKRVMKPEGVMITAINNKRNVNFYLMLKIEELLGIKPYVSRAYYLSG